jgi:hypothetical protein
MIDIKNRKLVLETAAKRLRQSGKTALARGLEDILRDGSNQAVNTPVEPAAEKQIVNFQVVASSQSRHLASTTFPTTFR